MAGAAALVLLAAPAEDAEAKKDGKAGKGKKAPCPAGQITCAGACTNPLTDPKNCGGCGGLCGPGESCSAGRCQVPCPASEVRCGNDCTSLVGDRRHCGRCFNPCPQGQGCNNDHCEPCPSTAVTCPGGGCCGGERPVCCQTVGCCPADQHCCDDVCTRTQVDPHNCGQCGKGCRGNEECVNGVCKALCVARAGPGSREAPCGTCATPCGPGKSCCDGSCTQVGTDSNNCGECGLLCPPGQLCIDGLCFGPTAPGKIVLSGAVSEQIPANGKCRIDEAGFLALFHLTRGTTLFTLRILLSHYGGPDDYFIINDEVHAELGMFVDLTVDGADGPRIWELRASLPEPILKGHVVVNKGEKSGRLEADLRNADDGSSGDGTIVHAAGSFTCEPL